MTVTLVLSSWTDMNKRVYIVAYKSFAGIFNLEWTPPKTRVQRKLPFIPTETEIDQLIARAQKHSYKVKQRFRIRMLNKDADFLATSLRSLHGKYSNSLFCLGVSEFL